MSNTGCLFIPDSLKIRATWFTDRRVFALKFAITAPLVFLERASSSQFSIVRLFKQLKSHFCEISCHTLPVRLLGKSLGDSGPYVSSF